MLHFLSKIFAYVMKAWGWVLLIIMALVLKFITNYPFWIEENYSSNIYLLISKFQRAVFGWVPFSIGDVFYAFIIIIVILKTWQLLSAWYKKEIDRQFILMGLKHLIFFFLFMYVFFYALWGLNYYRQGIAYQFSLEIKENSREDIDTLAGQLQQKLNYYAGKVNDKQRDSISKNQQLFERTNDAYLYAATTIPFFDYTPQSIKPSLFSYAGNYLGFQGYYNPFSGEAQVNTTIPRCLEPFVSAHETAHQLGYAKESEANFVAFLTCKNYPATTFQYSMYFDLYHYAITELWDSDSLKAKEYNQKLHPQAVKDFRECEEFYKRHQNPVETFITFLYGNFLVANNQPEGKRSYNRVINYLIAYYKKNGIEAI